MATKSLHKHSFFEDVWEVVRQVPRGRVTSYGAIANFLGSKMSARMVGLLADSLKERQLWAQRLQVLKEIGRLSKHPAQLRPQIEAYEAFCAEIGEKPADVALAWLLKNPVVTAPIIGARNLAQLESSLKAADIKLTPELRAEISTLSPEPAVATDRTEERV